MDRPFDNGKGYLVVPLSKDGKRKNFYVHRLVASAFLPHEKEKNVVNHKDHDRRNNSIENLEWCTQKENVRYSANRMKHEKSKYRRSSTGEKYIFKTKNGFRVNIRRKGIDKRFKTLEEARMLKDEVI